MKLPRRPPPTRRRWGVLALIVAVFAFGLTVVDAPGVENYVSPLDTDQAVAGRIQYQAQCRLKDPFDTTAKGSWQATEADAKKSAIRKAAKVIGNFVPVEQWDGGWTLNEPNGQEAFTDVQARCQIKKRAAKRQR